MTAIRLSAGMATMAGETASPRVARVGRWERIAALSGAASVAVLLIGDGIADVSGDAIDPGWPSQELVQALREHTSELGLGAGVVALAGVLAVVFLGTLWSEFTRGSEWLAVVGVAGGLLFATHILEIASGYIGLAAVEGQQDGPTARVLMAADYQTARLLAVPPLILAVASLVGSIRYDLFPRWFRWFNVALLVVLLLSLFPVGPTGLMALLGISWFLVASLLFAFHRP
jgi:hypothetical protein